MKNAASLKRIWSILACALIGAAVLNCSQPVHADDDESGIDRSGPRIVFLGDSITAAGHFVNDVEATLLLRSGGEPLPEIIGLGLGSETASGLTEPDHPFPRPNVHERLGRVLAATRPDIVVACYGLNDGIYHPLSEERFAAYREGMLSLIEKVQAAGARVALLTPPPYAGAVAPLRAPREGEPFGYKTPDPEYDEVLAEYAAWVLSLDSKDDVEVIDVRTPLLGRLADSYEKDPIHPNPTGHRIMAETLLSNWPKIDPEARQDGLSIPSDEIRWSAVRALVAKRRDVLDGKLLWEIGHQRPGKAPTISMEQAQQAAARIDREIIESLQGE